MLRLAELLGAPALEQLDVIVAGDRQRVVVSVALVEDAQHLDEFPAGAFCLASHACAAALSGYRLDSAVRLAAGGGAAALALRATDIPATAVRIAERSGLALLRVSPDADLADLVARVARVLEGGAAAALERIHRFSDVLGFGSVDDPVQHAAELAARIFAVPVEVRDERGGGDRVEVEVLRGGAPVAVLSASSGHGAADHALLTALRLGAAEAGRALDEEARRGEAPVRSRSLLLTELLLAPAERSEPLAYRARSLDLPIDGWHIVARLESSALENRSGQDELAELELADQIARVALQIARRAGRMWHIATTETAHLLVNMRPTQPNHQVSVEIVATARQIVERLQERFPALTFRIGVGAAHAGVSGLRASALEARAALASTSTAEVVSFDSAGLRTLLVEWYTSDTVRDSVQELLAPLDELGARRSQTAIQTLRAYLDHQGSLSKTAAALHLHRNAVTYRIRRIFDLLDLDPQDPDQRLALHLACRARDLA